MKTWGIVGAIALWAAPAGAWVQSTTESGAPISWAKRSVTFKLNSAGSVDVDFDKVEAAVTTAYTEWNEPDCSDMVLTYQGQTSSDFVGYSTSGDNANVVVWRETDEAWIHAAGVIAVTTVTYCTQSGGACTYNGAILDADIEMNGGEFTFTTNTRFRSLFDIGNTVTHEVGHFLGLDHTGVAEATMFASAPPGEVSKRSLHTDDISGLCDIYPEGQETAFWDDGADAEQDCTARPGTAPGQGGWFAAVLGLALLGRRRRR